jgi:hypothetical protein
MTIVSRSFVEALRFGATGGAALALSLLTYYAMWEASDPGTLELSELILPGLTVAALGALMGTPIAYGALILASIAADVAGRTHQVRTRLIGAAVALVATFVMLAGFNLARDMVPGAWTFVPPLLIGAYAAVVAWFRVPRILAR